MVDRGEDQSGVVGERVEDHKSAAFEFAERGVGRTDLEGVALIVTEGLAELVGNRAIHRHAIVGLTSGGAANADAVPAGVDDHSWDRRFDGDERLVEGREVEWVREVDVELLERLTVATVPFVDAQRWVGASQCPMFVG